MNNNKVVALVVGAIVGLFALSLLVRFFLLSQYGVPMGPFFFLGLPIGGIGLVALLLRVGLLNFGEKPGGTIHHWQQYDGVQAPPQAHPLAHPLASPPPAASVSQRLHDLDILRASGGISDMEYNAKRQQIISAI
jgi:hypothetical protein